METLLFEVLFIFRVSLTSTHFIKYMQLIQADLFCSPPQHGFNCIILKLINMKLTLVFFNMFELSLQFEYLKGNHARSSFIYTIGFWY